MWSVQQSRLSRTRGLVAVGVIGVIGVIGVMLVGCAAQRAQGPLDIHLGLTPPQTAQAVRLYDFCRRPDPDAVADRAQEVFPQCGRPGATEGDAWMVAHYQAGVVVRLQRFERWPTPARAAERWNQLIEKRAVDGAASSYARELIFARQGIPDGTEAWVAFQRGEELVGLYLLRVSSRDGPSLLEEIVPLEPPAAPIDPNPSR